MNVHTIDVQYAKQLLKDCPKPVQEYVRALESSLDRQKDLTNTAIKKIRELSKDKT